VSPPSSAAAAPVPEQDGPPAWPGLPPQQSVQQATQPTPVSSPAPASDADASFWDWSPEEDAEEMRFPIDEEGPAVPEATVAGKDAGDAIPGMVAAEEPPGAGPIYIEETAPRAEGIGHRLGPLDHIFGHTRMGIWRRRVAIAVVIGVVVSILVNWQVGVTLAVLAAIADAIFRSRTPVVASPLPGVKLTRSQKQTQHQLNNLEKAGYKALHARLIPDSEDHIDHLVIGPAGVFSIDSEYWDKHLPIRTKNARQLWHGPFSQKERLEHAKWEAEQASEMLTKAASPQLLAQLPGGRVTVRPAMVIYGPKIPWDVATIRDVDVLRGGRLRTYLRRYGRQNDNRPLTPTEIEQLHAAAHQAFPHLNPGILAPQPV
jgi:hypothetical protein